ncbi:Plasmodium exported protein (Pm-fam-a like), unknown function [Plasmodium malariae]|uniref:Fam-m protein n=1 Tax=Plasmodium malariae TaxID=5858 RepID=A0A1A8WUJ7_PLAMA|nr:Plasmodium exported protein (Pm-fam-a like), unknown function [Plasmodium malariae]
MTIKIFRKNSNFSKTLDLKSHRLLAKYNERKDSNIIDLKEDIQNNRNYEKKHVSNNVKLTKENNKQSKRSLLKEKYYTEVTDYNNAIFDGKHFHFEKKWIKKKGYDYYLEKRRRICDIALKKIKFRSYGFGFALFFIFFLFGIGIPGLYGIESLNIKWEKIKDHDFWKIFEEHIKNIVPAEIRPYIHIITFSILIIIISVIIIVAIYKILRNNEKYNKIKLIYA